MSVLRQDIITAITTRFAALTTPTYHNTLTGKVFAFLGRPPKPETLVDVRDTTQAITELSGAKWDRRMTVEIYLITVGALSAEAGRELIEDMYKAIATDRTWGGKAIDTTAIGDELETEQEESRVTGARVTIEILYRTGAWAES